MASVRLPAAEAATARRAMTLARAAAAAADAKDNATYLAKMEEAAALRPDFPRILVNLAAAQAANDRPDDAIATLNRLAALGMNSPVDKEEAFAPLRGRKDFDEVVKKLTANLDPKGEGEIAFTLSDVTGLIEGIAWREKTGEFYFGDVNGRAIWTKNKDGTLKRFTPATDDLLGVFGLAVDEAHGTLWAATSAVSAMHGFTPEMDGTAAVAEIDLDSGAVRRVVPVVRKAGDQQSHVLGDLALAPDGTVLATDSGGPTIWRLAPGGSALEAAVESDEFLSLQGIVVLPGGGWVVSDYASGLLRVDPDSHAVRALAPPATTTLIGIDGMALAPNGDILAIQNGLRPNRVLRIAFDPGYESVTGVTVLESAHMTMAAPSLGCVAGDGNFYFVGNAGWTRFENTNGEPSSPRSVPIFKTRVAAEPAKKKS